MKIMRKFRKQSITLILAVILILSTCGAAFAQSRSGSFLKNYTLTGDGVTDMVNIAQAQSGRSKSSLGYTEAWCADFVSDCAILAGQTAAIPANAHCYYLYHAVINAGGYEVSTPRKGDLVFYLSGSAGTVASWAHVGLMVDNVNEIGGNMFSSSVVATLKYYEINTSMSRKYVRPNYKTNTPQPSINYSTITNGTYYIKNVGTGKYLQVQNSADVNDQNIIVSGLSVGNSGQLMTISATSNGYKFRPNCSAARVVNIYADTITSGNNVNLRSDGNNSTQWFKFQKVDGGYVIRNVQNANCVLNVDGTNVNVVNYSGGSNQIWQLQHCIQFDANGGFGAPGYVMKNYTDNINLPSEKPIRIGYIFMGWGESSTDTTARYKAGDAFDAKLNLTLYALWRMQGDVNGDGAVDNIDLIYVARYVVKIDTGAYKSSIEAYCDFDENGEITNADLIRVARIIVGLDNPGRLHI